MLNGMSTNKWKRDPEWTAKRIAALRDKMGSTTALARALRVSTSAVRYWMEGNRQPIQRHRHAMEALERIR